MTRPSSRRLKPPIGERRCGVHARRRHRYRPCPVRRSRLGDLRADVVVDVNVILEGHVQLGDRVTVGANCLLRDCEVGDDTEVCANSFSRARRRGKLRHRPVCAPAPPHSVRGQRARGELCRGEESELGDGTKANHLRYVGDSTVGGASTLVRARSSATTMARTSTARPLVTAHSSARAPCWWRRCRSVLTPPSAPARRSPSPRPPASSLSSAAAR